MLSTQKHGVNFTVQTAHCPQRQNLRTASSDHIHTKRTENPETYLYDGRGSVVQLLQGGTVSQSYSYNAYGYINTDEYGIQAPFYGYNGEQHDPATGLQYLRARYYAPQNGGFISQDSFAGLLTDALSQNRYTYAQNNPVTFADPSGHSIWDSIKNGVTNAANAVKNTVTSVANTVKNTVTSAYNAVKNTVTNAYNAVKNTVTGAYNAAKNTVTSAVNTVSTAASSAVTSVRNAYTSIASSPAANAVFETLSNSYVALDVASGGRNLAPGVIQDFAESVEAFARHVCDAQMQHYTMQVEAQQAVNQATLDILSDVMNAVSGWWNRNSSTLMRGISTTLIGVSTFGVAAAAAPAAMVIGGTAALVAGGVAILGITDIVLGSIDLTAALFDSAEMRAGINSPGYVAVESGATLLSIVGSAALQPYVLLSDMMAKAAQANAAEAAQANAAEAAQANAQSGNGWDMPDGPTEIGGRKYTQHALERMAPDTPQVRAELEPRAAEAALQKGLVPGTAEYIKYVTDYVDPRGVPPMAVEGTIQTVDPILGNTPDTFVFANEDLRVVVNEMGDVITVIP